MIFGIAKDYIMDEAVEKAFIQLRGTFDALQERRYISTEKMYNNAVTFIYASIAWTPVSLIMTNIAFWAYDFSFLWIVFALASYPYLVYKSLTLYGGALMAKGRFYATLKGNVAQLHGEAKEVLTKFLKDA